MTIPEPPADPTSDAPVYVDPVTGQPIHFDPVTGQLSPTIPAGPGSTIPATPGYPPPGYLPPTYPSTYPPPSYPPPNYPPPSYPPPNYPPPSYPASGYPAPGYGAPTGYDTAGYGAAGTGTAGAGAPTGYPAYPATSYGGYPYAPAAMPRPTNGMAIASMVVSISGALLLFCYGFGGLLGLAGAILGHISRRQLRTSGEAGDGMALAGVIVGWIVLGLAVVIVVAVVILVVNLDHHVNDQPLPFPT